MSLTWRSAMFRGLPLIPVVFAVFGCGGTSEANDGRDSSVETTIVQEESTTTTSIPVIARDLPLVDETTRNTDDIEFAERLLLALCCEVEVDGVWWGETREEFDTWRTQLGLGPGALDADLWKAIYSLPSPEIYFPVFEPTSGVALPHNAIEIGGSAKERRFTLSSFTDLQVLRSWYDSFVPGIDLASWTWCSVEEFDNESFEYRWWKSAPSVLVPMLKLRVEPVQGGRVDVWIVEAGDESSECEGVPPPPSTTSPPAVGSGGSSGGTGGSPGGNCYVGMNLEECEDQLGYGFAERMVTFDCTGQGRSVLWARNWWIIGFSDGYPVVSKSNSGCS